MPWMYAVDDQDNVINHKGDSGPMSDGYWLEEGVLKHEANVAPRVGIAMRVGSIIARSFGSQDWWQTTPITEIIYDREIEGKRTVKFKTRNSIYKWIE